MDSTEFRLSWGECDPAGIVYFAAYLPWMERLHSGWWFERGLRFDHMLDRIGATAVTRQTTCSYLAPATVLERIVATMWLRAVGETSFTLHFDFRCPDRDQVVADAELAMVFVDRGGRSTAIPPLARSQLDAVRHGAGPG